MNQEDIQRILAAFNNAWPSTMPGKTEIYLEGFYHGMNFMAEILLQKKETYQ